jgi:hypothetical protein
MHEASYIIYTLINIHAYIIYYVEPIAICQENLLLLLQDVEVQQEEESPPVADERLAVIRELAGVIAVRLVGEGKAAAAVAVPPCLQGLERQLTHFRLTRRKYTVRLTKMLSNNMQALQRDEGVRVKAKSRLPIRSRGLL